MNKYVKRLNKMFDELSLDFQRFKDFVQAHKGYVLIILAFLFITYGIKLFYYDTSIDSEYILNSYTEQLQAWNGVGRYSLLFIKESLSLEPFNPVITNILTFIINLLSCLFLSFFYHYLFSKDGKETHSWIIAVIFIVSPIMAEQFGFILQSFEVALGILAIFISLFYLIRWIETKEKIYVAISIVLNLFSFGLYQAFLPFFISGVVISIIALVKKEDVNSQLFKTLFFLIVKYVAVFIISFVGYQLIIKLTTPTTGAYLNNQICWGKGECIPNIKSNVLDILKGNLIYYTKWFTLSILLVYAWTTYKVFKKKESIWLLFLSICLSVTPVLMTLVMGVSPVIRAQFCYPLVLGFFLNYLITCVEVKRLQNVFVCLVMYIAFNQAYVTSLLFYSDHMRYVEDLAVTQQLGTEIDSIIKDEGAKRVVFIGARPVVSSTVSVRGETLGRSYYEWDAGQPTGSSIRILGFMKNNGYIFDAPTPEDYQRGLQESGKMSVWPGKNSIEVLDDLIIIRLQ